MTNLTPQTNSFILNQNTLKDDIAKYFPKGKGIYLFQGNLGSGKTTIIKTYCQSLLQVPEYKMSSPSFGLINEYQTSRYKIYHIDLYRLEDPIELETLPLNEILNEEDCYVFIEWPTLLGELKSPHFKIQIEYLNQKQRRVIITEHTSHEESAHESQD